MPNNHKIQKTYFEIPGYENRQIKANLRYTNSVEKKPIVILSHGFKSFRNWGFMPYLSEQFAQVNTLAINIDFSWNGIDDEEKMIYDLDIFPRNTISSMIYDLRTLLSKLNERSINNINEILDKYWNGNIILFGHSLGGAISINIANDFDNISKILLWGAISKYSRNSEKQEKQWKEKGRMDFTDSRTGQELFLNYSYLEDKLLHAKEYDVLAKISKLNKETMIVHGKQDFTVKFSEAETLFAHSCYSKKILVPIYGCNHVFGANHPFDVAKKQLIDATQISQWFINK